MALYEAHEWKEGMPLIFHHDVIYGDDPGSYCYVNWHENVEILRFTEGEATVTMGDAAYRVKVDDIVVIGADVLHTVVADEYTRYTCTIIDREYLVGNGIDTSAYDFSPVIRDEALDAACVAIEQAVLAYREGQAYADVAARGAVLTLTALLCARYASARTHTESAGMAAVKQTVRSIRRRYAEELTLDVLACEVGLSKYHLARLFRRMTGDTIVSFINRVRCDSARHMLASGDHTVSETCALCGFSNLSYFSKTFRHMVGVLPSAYRKKE